LRFDNGTKPLTSLVLRRMAAQARMKRPIFQRCFSSFTAQT
jgi:hypothetical protein